MQSRTGSELGRAAWAALALLLAAAAALRLDGIRYGLPLAVLNPDEQSIVPRAWKLARERALDPGWFDYPTLVMYVLAPFQGAYNEPSYLAARLPVVFLGVATVGATWWLGNRAYGARAAWLGAGAVAVATTHVAYSRMAVTDVPLVLGVAVTLALLVAGRIEWAGVAAGAAASAKYPGALLAAPLVVAAWGRWRRLAVAAALAVVTFAVTSPFVVLRAGDALEDASRVQRLARAGWLGFEAAPPAPIAFADRLWEALGPVTLVGAAGLAVAAARRRRTDLVLATFVLAYFATLIPVEARFDRYVLPLLPPLAVLAGRTRALAHVGAPLLVVPLVWTLGDSAELRKRDTRVEAAAWAERHVPASAAVAADPSAPPTPAEDVTALELPGPGRPSDPRRDVRRLRARGVDYVVVTGAVTDRVLAARDRYPREVQFYADLERSTERVYRVAPRGDLAGPWVAIYRL